MLKEISIEIIRKCPNRCLHCSSFSSAEYGEIMPFDKFRVVIDGACELGLRTICFSGGEPFLHPELLEMIEYVNLKGLQSYIYTSGICMEHGKPSAIPNQMFDRLAGVVTKMIFNIEAADEETYDMIMGTQGCFPLLEASIKKAITHEIATEAHFVPMQLNMCQIEKTLQYCESLGVSKVSFLRLVLHGRALENREKLELSSENLEKVKAVLKEIVRKGSYNIRIGVPLLGETQESHCEAANGKLNIRYDGNVYPCEVFKNNRIQALEGISPSNIYQCDIKTIYNESKYLQAVRELVSQFACDNCCENCVGQYHMNCKTEK